MFFSKNGLFQHGFSTLENDEQQTMLNGLKSQHGLLTFPSAQAGFITLQAHLVKDVEEVRYISGMHKLANVCDHKDMIYNQNLKSAKLMKMNIRYQRHIISKIEQANNTECYNIVFGF